MHKISKDRGTSADSSYSQKPTLSPQAYTEYDKLSIRQISGAGVNPDYKEF